MPISTMPRPQFGNLNHVVGKDIISTEKLSFANRYAQSLEKSGLNALWFFHEKEPNNSRRFPLSFNSLLTLLRSFHKKEPNNSGLIVTDDIDYYVADDKDAKRFEAFITTQVKERNLFIPEDISTLPTFQKRLNRSLADPMMGRIFNTLIKNFIKTNAKNVDELDVSIAKEATRFELST